MNEVDVGFDSTLAGSATVAALATKFVLYPLVSLRRRRDGEDDGTGALYVPRSIHTPIVFVVCVIGGAIAALYLGEPLFPSVSSTITGLAIAHAAHDATKDRQ